MNDEITLIVSQGSPTHASATCPRIRCTILYGAFGRELVYRLYDYLNGTPSTGRHTWPNSTR